MNLTNHSKGLLCAAGTALCWGVLAIILKNALVFADSETIVAFRMIFAFAFLGLFFLIKNPKAFSLIKKPPPLLLVGCLGLAFNYLGFMKGVAYSGASNAQIMIQMGPLMLMLSGFLIYKESLKALQLFFIGLAFAGFVFFFKDQSDLSLDGNLILANLWILGAAVTWVGYSLVIKHFTAKGHSSNELNLLVFLVCAVILSTRINYPSLAGFGVYEWFLLLILGLNTLIAYGLFGAALKLAPASQVSIIITLNPILTLAIIAFGGAYFSFIPNEPVTLTGYLGAALVITGVIASTLSAKKVKKLKNWPT
jgi:drug/metabolite transporter (DMT)-like permease